MTEGVSVVQNTDSQASIGLPARSPAHPPVIRGVAVLGPAHALISGIRQVFANDGPGAESAAFFIVGADKLPHRRSLVHHAFVRRPEGDACWNEGGICRKLVPQNCRKDDVGSRPRKLLEEIKGVFRWRAVWNVFRGVGRTADDFHFGYSDVRRHFDTLGRSSNPAVGGSCWRRLRGLSSGGLLGFWIPRRESKIQTSCIRGRQNSQSESQHVEYHFQKSIVILSVMKSEGYLHYQQSPGSRREYK